MVRMIRDLFNRAGNRLLFRTTSSTWLAVSCCVGVYIAFCPWVGFHTILVLASAWFFPLHGAVMLAVSCCINNPWTMIPVYSLDYLFGQWIIKFLWEGSTLANPVWLTLINTKLSHYVGLPHFSLWTFLIGGNLLGIVAGVMLYPLFKRLCTTQSDRVLSWVHRLHLRRGDAQ